MICQRIGCSPMGTMGLGRNSVSSFKRVPSPPQRMNTGTCFGSSASAIGAICGKPSAKKRQKSPADLQGEHLTFCIGECREGMAPGGIFLVHGKAEASFA